MKKLRQKQWTLIVWCADDAGNPLDSVPLFSRNVLPLVAPVDAGTTVDSVVDTINRELYAPYTRGVLVTIANTSIAVYKLDMHILAFNGSCHGDQVTNHGFVCTEVEIINEIYDKKLDLFAVILAYSIFALYIQNG